MSALKNYSAKVAEFFALPVKRKYQREVTICRVAIKPNPAAYPELL